jgi:hypothetical protein
VNSAARRALLGDEAITRARRIAEAAPRLAPTDELYTALAVLLARAPKPHTEQRRIPA